MIDIELTDSQSTLTLPMLEIPLTEGNNEIGGDIQTLDGNVSTYFVAHKRNWVHTWEVLTEDQWNALNGFYMRQFVNFQYPLLSIDYYQISDVPVRMNLDPKQIADHCGTVQNVTINLRETGQLPNGDS